MFNDLEMGVPAPGLENNEEAQKAAQDKARIKSGKLLDDEALGSVEKELKWQLILSTVLMTPAIYICCFMFLPSKWCMTDTSVAGKNAAAAGGASSPSAVCMNMLTNFSARMVHGVVESATQVESRWTTAGWDYTTWGNSQKIVSSVSAFVAVSCGLWGGLAIGLITEYYTSYSYTPTQEVSESCETGAATNIIYGLALGYVSVILPSIILAEIAYIA